MKIDLTTLPEQPVDIKEIYAALGKVISVGEFVKIVKKRTGNDKISPSTIHYHLKETDNLDWIEWCGMCLIVVNKKSEEFNPGKYYNKTNTRIDSFDK